MSKVIDIHPNQEEVIDKVVEEAKKDTETTYTRELKKPIVYNGQEYNRLTFNFEKLTGNDFLEINAELTARGVIVVSPSFNSDFVIRVAIRACDQQIGVDVFPTMGFTDVLKITNRVRNFMINSEQ